jgi:hypothetical protein
MPADPEVGDLSSLLLTQADLLSFHSPAQLSNLAPEILAKLVSQMCFF